MKEILIPKEFHQFAIVTILQSFTGVPCPRITDLSESMRQRVTCMGALHPQKNMQCIPLGELQNKVDTESGNTFTPMKRKS